MVRVHLKTLIKLNYKLIVKYILNKNTNLFLNVSSKFKNEFSLLFSNKKIYYFNLYLKFSTFFYTTQLIDIYAYNLPLTNKLNLNNSIIVFNYHLIMFQKRFYIFSLDNFNNRVNLKSIAEIFTNAGWLEREALELSGLEFVSKKDTRNIMLQFSDNSHPFKKNFPVVGLREIFYDASNDLMIYQNVNLQF